MDRTAGLGPEGVAEFILRPRRGGTLLYLAVSGLFTGGGTWMVREGEKLGWWVAAFFGLCTAVFLVQLVPGSACLRLTPDGFEMRALFRSSSLRWTDVRGFGVVRMKQHGFLTVHTMVGFDFSDSYDRSRAGRALARAVAGCEGALPDLYGLKAEALASLLNAWRDRHADHPPSDPRT
jgi:hypothetical protein